MRCAFITCPRVGASYVQASVRSCVEQSVGILRGEIGVFSESLEPPEGLPEGVHVECRDAEYMAKVPAPTVYTDKSTFDAKCLSMGRQNVRAMRWVAEGGDFGCVFEDDVEFPRGWDAKALELAELAARSSPTFAMALVQYYPVVSETFPWARKCGKLWLLRWRNVDEYWGAQGTLYTSSAVGPITDHRERCIEKAVLGEYPAVRCNGDWGLKYALMGMGVPLYACDPNLVQHTGDVSTVGVGGPEFRGKSLYSGG